VAGSLARDDKLMPSKRPGFSMTQLINVVYGNFSMRTGVRVKSLTCPPHWEARWWSSLRPERATVSSGTSARPLLCTALKPLGLPASAWPTSHTSSRLAGSTY